MRKLLRAMFLVLALILSSSPGFPWGREGHQIVALIANKFMSAAAQAKAGDLLDGSPIDAVASWADEYRHDHRETAPWHYIDIPLADSKIDLARECPNGGCVIAKTEQFLAVLRDPNADKNAKAQALKFVIHFVGDLHQPLHDETTATRAVTRARLFLTVTPRTFIGCGTRACSSTSTATPRHSRQSWRVG